jgi:hypothetical protein
MAEKTLVYRINFDGLEAQAAAIGKVDSELTALNQTIKGQRDELSKQRAANEQNTQAYADLSDELGKNIVQQRNLSKAKGDLIRETQNEAKVLKENEGSIVSLRAQLSNLTKEYNNLTKAERESAKGQDVQKQAKAISDELKSLEGAIGDNRRNVGNYSDALKGLSGQFNVLGFNVGSIIDKFQDFGGVASDIVDKLQGASSAIEDATEATDELSEASSKSTGILGKVTGSLGKFRLALISTGIGAIVVIIGTLVAAFLSTQKGIDAATRAFKPLQVAFERIVGFIQNVALNAFESPQKSLKSLGDFIVGQFTNRLAALQNIFTETINAAKNLGSAFTSAITGDFSGASDALTAAGDNVKNVGSNFVDLQTGVQGTITKLSEFTAETIKTANQISDLEIKVRNLTNTNTELIAGYNEEIEALKAIAADTSKTAAEREKAGKQAIDLLEQRRLAQLESIDAEIQLLELNQSLSDTDAEGLQALEDLRAKRNQINKDAIAGGKEVTGQINAAIQAQVQANKAALDQLEKIRQDNSLSLIKDTEERTRKELEIQNKANLESVELLKVSENLKQQIRDAFNEQYKLAIDQLNKEIADSETEAIFQLNQARIEGQKQFITDKVALGQFELEQLIEIQRRELEVFEGTETEKNVLLQQQLNDRNAIIQQNDALLLQQKFDNEQARIETEQLLAESQAERDALAFELLLSNQAEELALFQGTEEQKTLLLADQAQKRNQILQAQQQAQVQSNLVIASSYASLFSSLAGLFKENAALQKAATLFQIGVDTAKAISAGIAGATTSATGTGVGAFVATPVFIATTITTILGAIAQATAALKSAPKFEYGGVIGKFALGGEIPTDGGLSQATHTLKAV